MYNIRSATVFDAQKLAEIGQKFFDYSAFKDYVKYSKESAEEAILKAMTQGCVFVAETENGTIIGGIVGLITPFWFNASVKAATELAWFIDEDHRKGTVALRLYKTFEEWGYSNGAGVIVMSDLVVDGETPAGKLFDKLGFSTVERCHIKGRSK